MKIIDTPALAKAQADAIARLTKACCTHDRIRLTYPYGEPGDDCRHYLLYGEDGALAAVLAMVLLDGKEAECSAFTHPACRRQGYFSLLLTAAMERFEEYDILFGVPESCRAAVEVLSFLGAELEAREHQMELVLPQAVIPAVSAAGPRPCLAGRAGLLLVGPGHAGSGRLMDGMPSAAAWTLVKGSATIGRCLITPVSDTCACLHHMEITGALRQKGYGSHFLSLLLPRIAASGIRKIILQVSGNNPAAVALYKKTGFRITETLSFYCY